MSYFKRKETTKRCNNFTRRDNYSNFFQVTTILAETNVFLLPIIVELCKGKQFLQRM